MPIITSPWNVLKMLFNSKLLFLLCICMRDILCNHYIYWKMGACKVPKVIIKCNMFSCHYYQTPDFLFTIFEYVSVRFYLFFHPASVKLNRGFIQHNYALLISLRGKWAFGLTHCMLIQRKLIGMSWLYPPSLHSPQCAFFQVFCLALD